MNKNKKIKNYTQAIISPDKINKFQVIINFYLYHAPNIESIHRIGNYDIRKQEILLKKMLEIANIGKERGKFLEKIQKKSWENIGLYGNYIDIKIPRFICSIGKRNGVKETQFESLLRHIRNSFVHGNVASFKNGEIVLWDEKENKKKSIIVITKNILRDWKACLEE